MEVQTAEEVHTVTLFDTTEQALALTDWVYTAMPKRANDPETFGDQSVVTWDNDIARVWTEATGEFSIADLRNNRRRRPERSDQ